MRTLRAFALLAVLLPVAVPSASAQTKPGGADVSVSAAKLASMPAVGDVFDVVYTVANGGPGEAPEAALHTYVPPELELRTATSSDPAHKCGEQDGGVTCALGTMPAGSSATITMTYRRIGARETFSSAWAGAFADDPVYENNNADVRLEADRSHPADLALTMAGPKTAGVGDAVEIAATVTNNGPERADSAHLFLPATYGLELRSVASTRPNDVCSTGEQSDTECLLGPLDPGESAVVTVSAVRASAYEVWGSGWVQGSGFDEVYDNDYASFSFPADPSVTSDLFVRMTGPASTPLVGETFELTITAGNRGPSAAGDVWLSDYLPPGVELVSTAPAGVCAHDDSGRYPMADAPEKAAPGPQGDAYYPIAPNGIFCDLGALAPDATETVTVTVRRTSAQEIWNSAWMSSSNFDPSYEDNYADVLVGPDKSNPADVSVTLDAPDRPEPGAEFDVTMTVSNAGPSEANAVTGTLSLPHGSELAGMAPGDAGCTYSGDSGPAPAETSRPVFHRMHEVACDFGTLAAGASASVTVTLTRTSEYEMWASAWTSTSSYDTDYENDYASALIAGKPYPGDCTARGTVEGTDGSDTIVAGDCAVESKAGADSVEMIPSSAPGDSRISTGRGADTVALNLAVGATGRRTIHLDTGPGRDVVTLTVAAGAGNTDVYVDAGDGADMIRVDAPAGVAGLRVFVLGGPGDDSLVWDDAEAPSSTYGVPRVVFRGGSGNDLAEGGWAGDRLHGGGGRDQLYGNLGDDYLRGGAGDDVCRGGPGTDRRRSC